MRKVGITLSVSTAKKVVSSWRRRIKAGLMVAVAAPGGRHTSCQASLQQIVRHRRKGEKPPKAFNKPREGEIACF